MTISIKPLVKAATVSAQGAVQLTASSADINTSGSVGLVPSALHVAQAIAALPSTTRSFLGTLSFSASTTLTIAQLNNTIDLAASAAITMTLPATSSGTPAPAGATYWFYNLGTGVATIQASGTDVICKSNTTGVASITIPAGGTAFLVSRGYGSTNTEWDVFGGTVLAGTAVTSVSGQSGAVVVQATDANTATGTTLIVNSGSTTGNITLKRIVAGSGLVMGTDGNGNMTLTASLAPVQVVVTASQDITGGFNGLNSILLSSAATANATANITAAAVTASTNGARILIVNSSATYTLTIVCANGASSIVYNGASVGVSGLAVAAGKSALLTVYSSAFYGGTPV